MTIKIAGLIKLRGYPDTYLYVARLLDPRVVAQLRATAEGVNQFTEIQAQRLGVQIAFAMMYAVIALIVLFSAVWIGLNFANYLVAPIRRLIGAAQVVFDRQPLCPGADPAIRGRPRPARRILQQDDPGLANAA